MLKTLDKGGPPREDFFATSRSRGLGEKSFLSRSIAIRIFLISFVKFGERMFKFIPLLFAALFFGAIRADKPIDCRDVLAKPGSAQLCQITWKKLQKNIYRKFNFTSNCLLSFFFSNSSRSRLCLGCQQIKRMEECKRCTTEYGRKANPCRDWPRTWWK